MSALQHRSLQIALAVGVLLALVACVERPLLPDSQGSARPSANDPTGPYRDEFIPGQSGNWLLEQDELGSTAIVNEQLLVTVASANTIQYTALPDRTFSDFVLEVDAWQRSGAPDSSYGVLFRMVDRQQFYRFEISGNGQYLVERHNGDGTWTRLIRDWTPTDAINSGLNVANRLKVIATGSDFALYVNDILLVQITDEAYASGLIALDAGSYAGTDLQVSFDNLSVTGTEP